MVEKIKKASFVLCLKSTSEVFTRSGRLQNLMNLAIQFLAPCCPPFSLFLQNHYQLEMLRSSMHIVGLQNASW